ncbi:hypothetical protein BH24ACT20_BH24ACT20_12990 [soil metagenome]
MPGRQRTVTTTGLALALLVIVLASCGPDFSGSPGSPETTQRRDATEVAVSSVEESEVREHISHLTGASPAPLSGGETVEIPERGSLEGRRAAAEYMKTSFEAAGAETRIIEFDSEAGRGFNVEATVQGAGNKHLWLTAHMDSVSNAGANDNASGLTSLLETAEAIAKVEPEQTVHFVAYDLEEEGLIGSSRYVEGTVKDIRDREGESAIIGNINSDMIGYEKDAFDAVMGTCDQSGPLDEAFRKATRKIDSPIELNEKCLGRSDHEHFWDLGLSALVLTDGSVYDNYPYYHAPSDTADKLNIRYLQDIIQLTTAATISLTNS